MFYKLRIRKINFDRIINKNIPFINMASKTIIFSSQEIKIYHHYQSLLQANRYFYRSEDKFIDYDKDYYLILGVSP